MAANPGFTAETTVWSRFNNRQQAANHWQKINYLSNCITGNLNILPPDISPAAPSMIYMLSRGEARLMNAPEPGDMAIIIAAGNILMPVEHRLNQDQATTRIKLQLFDFLKVDVATKNEVVFITDEEYTRLKGEGGEWASIPWLPATKEELRVMEQPETFTNTQARNLFTGLMKNRTRHTEFCPQLFYVLVFVSMSKRGTITDAKLDKILAEVQAQIGYGLVMNRELVSKAYKVFSQNMTADHVSEAFTKWSEVMEGLSLRLTITLSQAVGGGLTALSTVKKAMQVYPTFPWKKVAAMFPGEAANLSEGLELVKDDKYYGFKENLGKAAGTNFKNIAYVAKELMLKQGGDDNKALRYYAGWTRNPVAKTQLDDMVAEFDTKIVAEAGAVEDEWLTTVRSRLATSTGV